MPKCEGSCEKHVGEVKKYYIYSWPNCEWFYCQEAVEEDKRRGLKLVLWEERDA